MKSSSYMEQEKSKRESNCQDYNM